MNALTTTQVSLGHFGALPALTIEAPDGAQAIITLYGAHLVSWKSSDGKQSLFCSAKSALDGSRAIRGGVPVIFPQFGERGNGMRHGFARVSNWRLAASGIDDGWAFAAFELNHDDLAPAIGAAWAHDFSLRLRVAVRAHELQMSLDVNNTGDRDFSFSGALHGYFLIDQLDRISVKGLQGVLYSDSTGETAATQNQADLVFSGKLDRIYHDASGPLTLSAGAHTLRLEQTGFPDAVVWNPGTQDAAKLVDLADDEYERFVCIEPALTEARLLPAGASWHGGQRVLATKA